MNTWIKKLVFGTLYSDWQKGDEVEYEGKKGILMSKPKYVPDSFYYAEVKWEGSDKVDNQQVNLINFKNFTRE